MPEIDKREMFGEIFEFDKYVQEMIKRVVMCDQHDLTPEEKEQLTLYGALLLTLSTQAKDISKTWKL